MFFIDGEPWPPSLHGTGTEDYFCTAFGPSTEYCSLSGITATAATKPASGTAGKTACTAITSRIPSILKSLVFH